MVRPEYRQEAAEAVMEGGKVAKKAAQAQPYHGRRLTGEATRQMLSRNARQAGTTTIPPAPRTSDGRAGRFGAA